MIVVEASLPVVYCLIVIRASSSQMWPQDSIPQFKPAVTGFYSSCQDLALQLLLYMGKSLQLAVSAMQHNIVRKEHWLVEIFVRTMGSSKE